MKLNTVRPSLAASLVVLVALSACDVRSRASHGAGACCRRRAGRRRRGHGHPARRYGRQR